MVIHLVIFYMGVSIVLYVLASVTVFLSTKTSNVIPFRIVAYTFSVCSLFAIFLAGRLAGL
ncbi:hypothetical protein CYJ37_23420 [Bacillus sp. UMB0728]|nr:hypothetical protein CYJ37_23420 [Bacillus sp. UMB0728]